jgi:hypothetical protein
VTIETELHRIGEVCGDLQERGVPLSIVNVEVIVIDGDRLTREVEQRRVAAALPFVRFEGLHLFLRHPDEEDALPGREPSTVGRDELVLALASFERDERQMPRIGELLDRGHEAVVPWLQQRGGRYRVPEIIVEEVAQAARRLQPGHVGVQIHAVNAADFERHVLADNGVGVGRHRNLLGRSPMKVLQSEHARHCTGPNIVCFRAAAAIRRFAGGRRSRSLATFTTRSIVPRSFLAV